MGAQLDAVTFDFWNTIARLPRGTMEEARRRAVALACESCDVEVEADLLLASLEQVGAHQASSWEAGDHLHPSDAAEMLVRSLGLEEAARELVAEAYLTAGRGVTLELTDGIGPCVEALRERGLRLGIVCDVGLTGGALLRELLDGQGLLEHFSGWGFSDEVGHYKPSPAIFEAALGALGAEPARAAHVGDLRRTDVAGAAALGMRTVRYRGVHDDGYENGVEAEFVVASHGELPGLIDRLRS
jgi:FMN phosphatase YigB (HAD superfamily)